MKLRWIFRKDWYEGDVGENTITDINAAIWVLLHTLKAKEVCLVR